MTSIPQHTLDDGTTIPALGLGTWPMDDAEAERAVTSALHAGYRLIDTAANYRNETGVGRAVAGAGVPREEIVVTTKLPGRHHGYEETLASFEESRARLGLEYVDLYLIHWPLPRVDRYVDSWKAMVKLREDGLVRSIGVSNFTPAHIERLEKETGVLPSVNQVELHPFFPRRSCAPTTRTRACSPRAGVLWAAVRGCWTTSRWPPSPPRARRHPGAGGAALARPARRGAGTEVVGSPAAARQPGRVRVRAGRRPDADPLGPGAPADRR